MTRRDFIWKWLSYSVALLIVTVLNYQVLTLLPLGAVPVLLVTLAIAVGVLEGPSAGAGFGIAAGLMQMAVTHGLVLWVCALPFAGWLCGLVTQYVLRQDFVGYWLSCLAAMLLYDAGQAGLRWLWGTAELPQLLRVAIPEYLWTVAFAIPVYHLCRFCHHRFGRAYYE